MLRKKSFIFIIYMISGCLLEQDIFIQGRTDVEDERNAGYNIGDLLNMPYLAGSWPIKQEEARMEAIGRGYVGSILNNYVTSRPPNENIPCVARIRESLQQYQDSQPRDIYRLVKEPGVLCVHVRSGDVWAHQDYLDIVKRVSANYEKVIILSGIHLDEHFKKRDEKIAAFLHNMNDLLAFSPKISLFLADPDVHLVVMKEARNLLVHRGGFSTLGTIVCTGNLFVTGFMEVVHNKDWQRLVNTPYTLL